MNCSEQAEANFIACVWLLDHIKCLHLFCCMFEQVQSSQCYGVVLRDDKCFIPCGKGKALMINIVKRLRKKSRIYEKQVVPNDCLTAPCFLDVTIVY